MEENKLDFVTIDLKELKKKWNLYMLFIVVITVASIYIQSLLSLTLFPFRVKIPRFSYTICVFIMSIIFAVYRKRKIPSFKEDVDLPLRAYAYTKFYSYNLLNLFFQIALNGVFYIVIGKSIFLYIHFFLCFLVLIFYPKPNTIKKILKNDEIMFTE